MTGTSTEASPDQGQPQPQSDQDFDAKIASLLGDDVLDDDDAVPSIPEPPADTGEDASAEEAVDDDDEDQDDGDWDTSTEDDDDTADDAPEGGRFVSNDGKVKLPDGTVTTIAKLKEGALLQEEYQRRQSQVQEQASQVEQLQAKLSEQFKAAEQKLAFAAQLVEALTPQQPPSMSLIQTDPEAYEAQMLEYQQMQQIQAQVKAVTEAAEQERSQASLQTNATTMSREIETFLTAEPALRDEAKRLAFQAEAMKVMTDRYGMKPEDFEGLNRAWMLRMAADVVRYNRIKEARGKTKTSKKLEGKPSVRKPAGRKNSGAKEAQYTQALRTALSKTGRTDIADRLLETMVD